VKNCGRQHEGSKVAELGICLASQSNQYEGKNNGEFAGRYCWKLAGTLFGGQVQGSFASKMMDCTRCEVFIQVKQEEGDEFQT